VNHGDYRACSVSGKAVADVLTIVTSHEIREALTDADLNARYDAAVQPEYSNGLAGKPDPGCVVP
jgi:hypothetical protein